MKRFGLVLTALVLTPGVHAADFWWPKGGEEIGYYLLLDGQKVGKSHLKFSKEGGIVKTLQEQRVKADVGGVKAQIDIAFREQWQGERFVGMTTYGHIKTPAGNMEMRVLATRDESDELSVESKLAGKRAAGPDRLPATFWHLTHITSEKIFDPFIGGFADLKFESTGAQVLEIDGAQKECLAFDLHVTYEDASLLAAMPTGVDPEDIPLDRTYKAWFEPDGVMCALLTDTPIGQMTMFRSYRKTDK